MSVVEVDPRFRVTIPKEVRKGLRVSEGQKLYVVSYGGALIMKPIPDDPAAELDRLLGDFRFDAKSRKKAEEWLLKETSAWR